MKKTIFFLSFLVILSSCDVLKQVAGAYSFTQCEYEYNSISGLTLGGINLQNVTSLTSLNPLTAASLLTSFSNNSPLPLQFTLNLNVKNPNLTTASLSGLQYILEIDGVQMTEGMLNKAVSIISGESAVVPVLLSFDLKEVLSGQSADAVKNFAFNFIGLGNAASNVTIKLRPNMTVGTQSITSPVYIPVSFTYGKGHK